jgi:flagellar basal-body rod modification protein FlgD
MGKNEFLKLLTTQLRYQDPMEPLKGQDMAAQLAQFSGLEQLVNISEQISNQEASFATLTQAMNNTVAISTIGKSVIAAGNQVALTTDPISGKSVGEVSANVTINGQGTLRIYDASGNEVGNRSLGFLGVGRQTFDVDSAGKSLPAGKYTFKIEVNDNKGVAVPQQTFITGRVDGISYSEEGAILTAGPLKIKLSDIVQILA